MHLQLSTSLFIASLYLTISLASPLNEQVNYNHPLDKTPLLDTRVARTPPPPPPPPPPNCPTQKPIAQNLCTSGSPYCCSGSGASQVCGPAASVSCASTTICCINTNGMQICAGEIDFTGPVTININLGASSCEK